MGKKYFGNNYNYYAVIKGRIPGIYNTWKDCKEQVYGFSGAFYKGFIYYEEAEDYLNNYNNRKNKNENQIKYLSYAYIKGYFNNITNYYGYDGYIYYNDEKYIIKGYDNNPNYVDLKNIAGQIIGCKSVIEKSIELGIRNLDFFYDYEGIKMWSNGKWSANKYGTIEFYEYMQSIKSKININFIKNDKFHDIYRNNVFIKEVKSTSPKEEQNQNKDNDINEFEINKKNENEISKNEEKETDNNIIKMIKINRIKKTKIENNSLYKIRSFSLNGNLLLKRKLFNKNIKEFVQKINII